MASVLLVGSFVASSVVAASPASATTSPDNSDTVGGNTFYAYVAEGETLEVAFQKTRNHSDNGSDVDFRVTDPAGTIRMECTIAAGAGVGASCDETGFTGPAGVWIIEEIPRTDVDDSAYLRPASNSRFTFDISVRSPEAGNIPGRVWTDVYMAYDRRGGASAYDLSFWIVSEYGAVYSVDLRGFTGGGWAIDSNAFGVVDGETCNPLYRTTAMNSNSSAYNHADSACGDEYRVFFEEPADDLPASAASPRGDLWVLPEVTSPEIGELGFSQDAAGSMAGTFDYTLRNFTGAYELRIDIDGDGEFDGPRDRVVPLGGTAGEHSYRWDGLDGQGDPVDVCAPLTAEVAIDRADEVHMVLGDVEGLSGGIAMTQLRGNSPGNTTIYWDDSRVSASDKTSTTSPRDATGGVDSSGGVHRWTATGSNPWGNQLAIDHWSYSPVDIRERLTMGNGCLEVNKTSDATEDVRPGDTVTYTVTARNTGSGDYTAEDPAVLFDDLSGVLDDASYAGDAEADRPGEISYEAPLLSWVGALPAGESVALTYTVTLTGGGDRVVRNVGWAPEDPGNHEPPACDPADERGLDPQTGLPCASTEFELPALSIVKEADRADLPSVGEEITYTVTVVNEGPGDYTAAAPATFSDDLSDVLDDADLVDGSLDASVGDASVADGRLSWSGVLAAGERATVSYTLVYTGAGDRLLRNTACVPEPEAAGDPCATVGIPGSGLSQWKQVEASDAPVVAGTVLTYTLFFENTGKADAVVDAVDDLTHVIDDAEVTAEPASTDLQVTRDGNRIAITGTVPAGETAEVTYRVTIKADEERGDDIAANFLLDPGAETPGEPGECVPDDGERPDCTTTPIGRLITSKSVTATDDPLVAGSVLRYELTFRNDGEGPARVDHTDHLAGVLDDTALTAAPVASDKSLTASPVEGDRFTVTGELAAGRTVTVVYEVTVNNESDRGDNLALNFLVPSDQEPREECDVDDTDCTVTPLPRVVSSKSSDPVSGETVVAGQEVSYTLTFRNDGRAAGLVAFSDHLSGVLDDADLTGGPVASSDMLTIGGLDDGRLDVAGVLEPGQEETVSYTVTVRPDGQRGDNVLGNVLVRSGDTPPGPNDPCEEEDPNCTSHPVPEIVAGKSVDPASGTPVGEGQELTYTLSFQNIGHAAATVDYTDDLRGVLDDAELFGLIVADDGLVTTGPDQGVLRIVGTVRPGETAKVSYTVRVREYQAQGDHLLANFLAVTGEEPPAKCVDENPLCTQNPAESPEDGLAATGGTLLPVGVALAVVALLGTGVLLMVVSRRRLGAAEPHDLH